jgi:uncharacterized protein (DUF111 family)
LRCKGPHLHNVGQVDCIVAVIAGLDRVEVVAEDLELGAVAIVGYRFVEEFLE